MKAMFSPTTHAAIAHFLAGCTRAELDRLAAEKDLPLHTLEPDAPTTPATGEP